MNSFRVGAALLLCPVSVCAQKTRFGQELPFAKPGVSYPLTVHVYGLHVRPDWEQGYCINVIFADVSVNGRKLELRGGTNVPEKVYKSAASLSFGDFHARVLKKASGVDLGDEYELLLPDRRVFQSVVSGMAE